MNLTCELFGKVLSRTFVAEMEKNRVFELHCNTKTDQFSFGNTPIQPDVCTDV